MNFEALGRYTEATQRIDRLKAERHNAAIEIKRLLGRAEIGHTGRIEGVDVCRGLQLMQEMADKEADLLRAIQDANAAAEHCQQPRINLVACNEQ